MADNITQANMLAMSGEDIDKLMKTIKETPTSGTVKMSDGTKKLIESNQNFFQSVAQKFEKGFQAFEKKLEKWADQVL